MKNDIVDFCDKKLSKFQLKIYNVSRNNNHVYLIAKLF